MGYLPNGFGREAPSRAAAIEGEPMERICEPPEWLCCKGVSGAEEDVEEASLSTVRSCEQRLKAQI